MADAPGELLRLKSARGRRLIATAVLGSGMVALDGTIVNVALPRMGRDLDATLRDLQWIVNGYTLTLASFIIIGGSIGDAIGRKRAFGYGVVAFALSSALVALAPSATLMSSPASSRALPRRS